jgi:hypothetical protein
MKGPFDAFDALFLANYAPVESGNENPTTAPGSTMPKTTGLRLMRTFFQIAVGQAHRNGYEGKPVFGIAVGSLLDRAAPAPQ